MFYFLLKIIFSKLSMGNSNKRLNTNATTNETTKIEIKFNAFYISKKICYTINKYIKATYIEKTRIDTMLKS